MLLAITKVNEIRQMAFVRKVDTYAFRKSPGVLIILARYYRALRQKKNLEFVLGKKLTLDSPWRNQWVLNLNDIFTVQKLRG